MITERKIILYEIDVGVEPLFDWFQSLDRGVMSRVYDRIDRVKDGNLGDYKKLRGGLCELRLRFGLGYRLYFFEVSDVVLETSKNSKEI